MASDTSQGTSPDPSHSALMGTAARLALAAANGEAETVDQLARPARRHPATRGRHDPRRPRRPHPGRYSLHRPGRHLRGRHRRRCP